MEKNYKHTDINTRIWKMKYQILDIKKGTSNGAMNMKSEHFPGCSKADLIILS